MNHETLRVRVKSVGRAEDPAQVAEGAKDAKIARLREQVRELETSARSCVRLRSTSRGRRTDEPLPVR